MKLEMLLDENMCIDHYKGIIDNGATKTTYTVIEGDDVIHVDHVVTLGKKEIFKESFILDLELVEALKEIDLI